jgi:hypothetical protein
MLSIKKMTKSKKIYAKLCDLRHEQVTIQNVIREKKVAEYDIKDYQDHLKQSFEVLFIRTHHGATTEIWKSFWIGYVMWSMTIIF